MAQNIAVSAELLYCSICEERYKAPSAAGAAAAAAAGGCGQAASNLRVPRVLQCGHTHCHVCLVGFLQHSSVANTIECPLCRHRSAVGPDGAASLPVNFLLIQVLDAPAKPFKSNTFPFCQACEPDADGVDDDAKQQPGGGGKHRSMVYCPECCEFLCADASRAHALVRQTRNHKPVELTEQNVADIIKRSKEVPAPPAPAPVPPAPAPPAPAPVPVKSPSHRLRGYTEPSVKCPSCDMCGPSSQTGQQECSVCRLCSTCCKAMTSCFDEVVEDIKPIPKPAPAPLARPASAAPRTNIAAAAEAPAKPASASAASSSSVARPASASSSSSSSSKPQAAVDESNIRVGDNVSINVGAGEEPIFGWGSVKAEDVGIVREVESSGIARIDFPRQIGWRGLASQIKKVAVAAAAPSALPLKAGDLVRVSLPAGRSEPRYKWGSIRRCSVGTLVYIDDDRDVVVEFPEDNTWRGVLSELVAAETGSIQISHHQHPVTFRSGLENRICDLCRDHVWQAWSCANCEFDCCIPCGRQAGAHPGQWRDQSVTRYYCSTTSQIEGPLCVHGPRGVIPVIQDSHWSCCGSTEQSSTLCSAPPASSSTPLGLKNRAGVEMAPGNAQGASFLYCSRVLGQAAIPESDGQCGPNNGPQCADCRAVTSAAWSNQFNHRGRHIVLFDSDRRAGMPTSNHGWIRSGVAISPRSGLWRWILHFGSEDGGKVYQAGFVSEHFDAYNESGGPSTPHSWFIQNDAVWLDTVKQGNYRNGKFAEGDMVAFELNRPANGVACSLRIINLRTKVCTVSLESGLPASHTLFAAAVILDPQQTVTLVQAPTRVDAPLKATVSAAQVSDSPEISPEVAMELMHDLALEMSKQIK